MGKLKTQRLSIGKKQDLFQERQERSPCGRWKAAEDHKCHYFFFLVIVVRRRNREIHCLLIKGSIYRDGHRPQLNLGNRAAENISLNILVTSFLKSERETLNTELQ